MTMRLPRQATTTTCLRVHGFGEISNVAKENYQLGCAKLRNQDLARARWISDGSRPSRSHPKISTFPLNPSLAHIPVQAGEHPKKTSSRSASSSIKLWQ